MITTTVQLVKGDTWQRAWLITYRQGQPVDLTGATARLHVRTPQGALQLNASAYLSIAHPGRIDLLVPYADTDTLDPGTYAYDLEVTYPSGVRRTYEQARLIISEDYTRD